MSQRSVGWNKDTEQESPQSARLLSFGAPGGSEPCAASRGRGRVPRCWGSSGQEERLSGTRLPGPPCWALAVPSLPGQGALLIAKSRADGEPSLCLSVRLPPALFSWESRPHPADPGARFWTGSRCWCFHRWPWAIVRGCTVGRLKQACLERVKTRNWVTCGLVLISAAQKVGPLLASDCT